MNDCVTASVQLEKFAEELNLEIVFRGREVVTLSSMSVERPGLQLAGFFDYFDSRRIIVLGLTEHEYLRTFTSKERQEKISRLFSYGEIPCIILSRNLEAPEELLAEAKSANCPVFRSPKITTDLMSDLYIYVNRQLAPSTSVHGGLMEVFGVGILLVGQSGVGKSETAMELIKRGHRLIADDNVILKEIAHELTGTAPEAIRHFMELRGIGIINVRNMYGSGSILDEKTVQLVIELEHWQRDKSYARIGDEEQTAEYLGVKLPKLTIPVSPGRNLAIIIEVAARNYRLKSMGYDASEELISRSLGR